MVHRARTHGRRGVGIDRGRAAGDAAADRLCAVALTLAAIGIYGVMAYSVRRRTRELGTRVALGASRADIVRLVMREGGVIALAGVGVGLVTGVLAARSLSAVLFGVPPSDPWSMAAAALLLGADGDGRVLLPARRASRVDPARTLWTLESVSSRQSAVKSFQSAVFSSVNGLQLERIRLVSGD